MSASSSAEDRAFALVSVDPTYAAIHLLLADLSLRDESAHAEPYPAIRAKLHELRPSLWQSYARLLEELKDDFDSDSERCATRRGFEFSAASAEALLTTPEDRACFERGAIAWNKWGTPCVARELTASEIAEHSIVHTPAGAAADLRPTDFAALECPELLTALKLTGGALATALTALARASNIQSLTLNVVEITGDEAEAQALEALSIEALSVTMRASTTLPFPPWISRLPALRSLSLAYSLNGTSGGATDTPAEVATLMQLESLDLHYVRTLPEDIGKLSNLRSLSIYAMYLTRLPDSLVALERLEKLRVEPVVRLPGVPNGFERLTALRELRLSHLSTEELPTVLLRMPWLRRVELVSGRRWPLSQQDALRAALPNAAVFIHFTGNAY